MKPMIPTMTAGAAVLAISIKDALIKCGDGNPAGISIYKKSLSQLKIKKFSNNIYIYN